MGGQSAEERDAFLLLQNPADPAYSGGRESASYLGITSVTPTILAFIDPHNFHTGFTHTNRAPPPGLRA